jgi:transaldolase
MQIFLDTANIDEIKRVAAMGLLDGVTTNPSLVAKESGDFRDIILTICEIVKGPVNAEVVTLKADEMVEEGRELAKIHQDVVVKVPMTPEGLVATKKLSGEDIPINVTLIFSASQALLAAKAGATYVSPFIGRLDDISNPGMEIVSQIRTIFDNYGISTQILAASLRHPVHFMEAAMVGADVATLPAKVFHQLFKHPLTDIGLKKFLEDWESAKDRTNG